MRLLIIIVLLVIFYRVVKSAIGRGAGGTRRMGSEPPSETDDMMVHDPVCGVYFPRQEGVPLVYEGKELLFCSTECRDRFLASKE